MRPRIVLGSLLVTMLLTTVATSLVANETGILAGAGLDNFQSMEDLRDFLDKARSGGWVDDSILLGTQDPSIVTATALTDTEGARDFSTTNVQVEGVDEADWIKSDGQNLYIAGEDGITVLQAYPPEEMAVLSRISKSDLLLEEHGWIVGMFLAEGKLLVISSSSGGFLRAWEDTQILADVWYPTEARTYVSVFDILNPASPTMVQSLNVSGSYQASRFTSGHMYLLTQVFIYAVEEEYNYPTLCDAASCQAFEPQKVYHDPDSLGADSYNVILALNPLTGESDSISVISGYASTVYMSLNNLYVTFPKYGLGGVHTSIYRIAVDGLELWPAASGDVTGYLLNQFSMDEEGPYLRVVTTTGWNEANNVYVLGEALQTVGSLEGLAPGESVYSSRFVGSVLYLVTFKKVDPFFVIDLSIPSEPTVLGFLKIPGFSEYLHPWGDGLVLGVGKDTMEAEEGDFAWFQGLKLSLFDVSNVEDPKELAKLIIGERGTDSPVLNDHKAFLGIPERDLLVIPVMLVESYDSWTPVWQGAYVISATAEGFEVLGRVTHHNETTEPYEYWYGPHSIQRSAYIDDYLYTISRATVKVNLFADLSEVGHIDYGIQA